MYNFTCNNVCGNNNFTVNPKSKKNLLCFLFEQEIGSNFSSTPWCPLTAFNPASSVLQLEASSKIHHIAACWNKLLLNYLL